MNFFYIFVATVTVSTSLLFSQTDISREIAKLKRVDASHRYIIMNRIKQQLAGMNAKQRAAAIAQLRGSARSANQSPQSKKGRQAYRNGTVAARGPMAEHSTGHGMAAGSPHMAPQIPTPSAPNMPQGGHVSVPSHSNPVRPPHHGPGTPPVSPPVSPPVAPPHTGPQNPPNTGPQTPPHNGPGMPPGTGPQTPPGTGPQMPPHTPVHGPGGRH